MRSLRLLNAILLGCFGTAFALGHLHVAALALGLSLVVCGVEWVRRRSNPLVPEGRYPFTHATGAWAVVTGVALLALGIALLVYAVPTACMLGWNDGARCG